MKKIFYSVSIFSFLFFISCSSAAYKDVTPEQVKYQKVYEMQVKDEVLFNQAARYVNLILNNGGMNSNKAMQQSFFGNYNKQSKRQLGVTYSDKNSKIITGSGMVNVSYTFTPVETYYDIEIMIKENRMRILFTNMQNGLGLFTNQAQLKSFIKEADKLMANFIEKINVRDDNF